MNDRIKEAFDKVKADDAIKKNTSEYIFQKTKGYRKRVVFPYKRLATVTACFLAVLLSFGGYSAYFTATAAISVDINPSVELGINRFDKVISVDTYNEDGFLLMTSMDIRFLHYEKAVEQILASESMEQYLAQDQCVVVTVFGKNEEKNAEILTKLNVCTDSYGNVHCSSGNSEEAAAAHSAGLSFGKYKAFLELHALNPDISTEDVKGLTMRQIRDMINVLSGGREDTTEKNNAGEDDREPVSGTGYDSDNGNCNGYDYGNGYDNGNNSGNDRSNSYGNGNNNDNSHGNDYGNGNNKGNSHGNGYGNGNGNSHSNGSSNNNGHGNSNDNSQK